MKTLLYSFVYITPWPFQTKTEASVNAAPVAWTTENIISKSMIDDDTNIELKALYAVQVLFVQLQHQVYKVVVYLR